jgi:short-subunit dehydrogenase
VGRGPVLVTGAGGFVGMHLTALLGRDAVALDADVLDGGAVAAAVAATTESLGPVEVLVNNAGWDELHPFLETGEDFWRRVVDVNYMGCLRMTRAVLPGMLERRSGHIVNVGSIVGHVGRRNEAAYSATKAAVVVFSESLAAELAGTGVAVTLVTPGVVSTRFFERRGTPYHRRWPRPVAPDVVAARVVDGLQSGRAEVVVPRWLSLPVRLRGALPGLYRALARRFD